MGKKQSTLTQARLKELLDYDPETGVFRWKVARGKGGRWPADRIAGCLSNGRRQIRVENEHHYGYRLAWLYVYGEMPDEIDHKDGDPSNDRIDNLRECTHAENMRNRKGKSGCSYYKRLGLWHAMITVGGRTRSLGYYVLKASAVRAHNKAAMKYHGEFARPVECDNA